MLSCFFGGVRQRRVILKSSPDFRVLQGFQARPARLTSRGRRPEAAKSARAGESEALCLVNIVDNREKQPLDVHFGLAAEGEPVQPEHMA